MNMMARLSGLPRSFYVIALLGMLGVPSVFFTPLLLRWVPVQEMAIILVAQAYVYYLVIFQQFGFNLSGPARLGHEVSTVRKYSLLMDTTRFKLGLLVISMVLWVILVVLVFPEKIYLGAFVLLLLSYALNANWYLQTENNFSAGAVSALVGVLLGVLMVVFTWLGYSLGNTGYVLAGYATLALILPQAMVGMGSYIVSQRSAGGLTLSQRDKQWPISEMWCNGWPLVVSQLLLLGSTTLGTLLVSYMAAPDVTAAYAATEKMFNLAATVLIALFTVHYPQLARCFAEDRLKYWRELWRVNLKIAGLGVAALVTMSLIGNWVFGIYLGDDLARFVAPALIPFALWLTCVPFQNALQCHLAVEGKTRWAIMVAIIMLVFELVIGGALMMLNPVYWVYGMVAAQLPAIFLLTNMYRSDVRMSGAN